MNHQLIYSWLGLPPTSWPPDHYTLLGLEPGENDVARIEQHVHERMDRIRHYQLSNPDAATEAMNRLAQALNCLTNPDAKKSYDAALPPRLPVVRTAPQPPPASPRKPPAHSSDRPTAAETGTRTVIDWDTATTTRPARPPARPEPALAQPEEGSDAPVAIRESAGDSSPVLVAAPADPIFETARSSPEARRGLGTRRGLYDRVTLTRQLLRAWDRAGKYVGRAKRHLTRPAEETELENRLTTVADLLEDFPAFLGRPGQPGQHVATLASQRSVVETFKKLDRAQREALAKDWLSGRMVLSFHRRYLLQQLRQVRKLGWWGWTRRAIHATLDHHPGYVFLGMAVIALAGTLVWLFSLGR